MAKQERRRRFRWAREFWTLARPYWTSEDRWVALGLLAVIVSCILFVVVMTVRLNRWYQEFYDMAGTPSASVFFGFLLQYCWIAGIWIAVERLNSYLKYRLSLRWRESMTRRFVELWMSRQKHYFWSLSQQGTDNPDQRISEDINLFVKQTLALSLDLLDRGVSLITFSVILWNLSGSLAVPLPWGGSLNISGYLFFASVLYASASNGIIYRVGRRLVALQYDQQHREADFRYALMRLRENGASIALARGEPAEIARATGLFGRVVDNFRQLIRKYVQIEIFSSLHGQVKVLFPLVMGAPRFLSGAIKIGGLFQISDSFGKVESSISILVKSFRDLSEWRSAARRLSDFEESLSRASELSGRVEIKYGEGADELVSRDLELRTPDGRVLSRIGDLEIRAGESWLISGPSGSGKSTLLRAVAGLWPFMNGGVEAPRRESAMFVSQAAYLPRGSLRQAILYPGGDRQVSDRELGALLAEFGLIHLTSRLGHEDAWDQVLSPGEQQRVVLIRALVRKPRWLFLDEATSALDDANQAMFYERIRERIPGVTIVSVGHRKELRAYHDRELKLEAEVSVSSPS